MYSYGVNNSIDLNKERITQLAAPNGSGKSSIAFILQEILFNKNTKGIKKGDILNKYSKSKTWDASLSFEIDNDSYVLEVVRSGAQTKVTLHKNGIDISEHKVLDTYKKLHDILGMSFDIFSQLSYQSSTDLLEFLKATDSNRKKFLINLFGFEKYLEIGESIKLIAGELDRDLVSLKGELKTVEDYLKTVEVATPKEFVEVPEVDEELSEQIIKLEAALQNIDKDSKLIDKNNLYKREREELVFDISLSEPKNPDIDSNIQQCRDQANHAKRIVEDTQKKLKDLDVRDSCYACGQPLDNSQSMAQKTKFEEIIKDNTETYNQSKQEYLRLKDIQDSFKVELDKFLANKKKIERFETLTNLIDTSLPSETPDRLGVSKKLKELKDAYASQQFLKNKAEKFNEDVRLHNTKIEMLLEEKEKFYSRQSSLNNDIVNLQSKANRLQILKKAFSPSGIVAFKLENVAKDLEQTINRYLSVLSDGQFSVIFRLIGEKLNVVIINNGQEVTIESLSGGEFSRVQTSVLLAVRSTLSKIGGNNLNLLFLDEITGVLDEAGKEKLFEVLSSELDLNVFLISHDYSHPLIPKIEIVKKNNISKLC